MHLTPGTRLGPYEILSGVGAGGMGEVYRARDARLGRDVAIKVLPERLAADPLALTRFEREARALAALSHPNLVAIHDFGVQDGKAYAVMEMLEGSSLRERLASSEAHRGLSPRRTLDYAVQISRGLAAAHGKQIVHRDLKPENVFVTTDGRVKILDFGLAWVPEVWSAEATTIARATHAGVVMGTIGYMAPEQVRGEPIDHRTDIFALGCVLYEMSTGRRAFERATAVETMTAILHDDPPLLPGPAEAAAPLDRIIARCLEKQPDERFQSASDLAFHLQHAQGGSGASRAMPAAPARSRRAFRAGVAAVAFAAVAGAGWLAGRTSAPRDESAPHGRFVQLTDLPGVERWPSLAPDGQSIAYAALTEGNEDVFVLRVGGRNPVNLTPDSPTTDSQPAFSPDSSRIAFRSERGGGGIFVMGATGESVRRVTDFGFAPSWSPDASELIVSTSNFTDPFSRNAAGKLFAVNVATGERRLIDDGDAVQPAWSPNGHRVAFWGLAEGARRDIWTVPAAGPGAGARVSVTSDAATDWYPRWSADGRWLYFLSDRGGVMNLWRVPIDESSGRLLGAAESVVTPALALSGITFARSGQMAYATSEHRSRIERLTLDPVREQIVGSAQVVLRDSRRISFVEWSPDSAWLTFSVIGTRENIFLVRPDGSGYRQVTDDEFRNRGGVWAPDGSSIAFFSNRSGQYQIWSVRPDGSALRQITHVEGGTSAPIWSPAGDMLAVGSPGATRGWSLYDLGKGQMMATPQRPAADGTYFQPMTWSADGQSIAGVQMESARSAGEQGQTFPVFIYSVRDRTYRPVKASGGVLWMNDSRRLLVYHNREMAIVDAETGRQTTLVSGLDRQAFNQFWRVSLTRDNRGIAVVSDEAEGNLWTIR